MNIDEFDDEEQDADDDYDGDGDGDEEDEDEESPPSDVFVSMAFGREGSDEAWKVIRRVCNEFDLTARRAHQDQVPGSPSIDEVVDELVESCEFAVIDLTHERPSVAHEVGLCDREFDRPFILLLARKGTQRFGNIQGRLVNYYSDMQDLERILRRQLRMMLDEWDALPGDEAEDSDD